MTSLAFAKALLDSDLPVPAGLVDPKGRPAPRRFAVYRNNVAVGLTKALEDAFPVVRALVGDAFFAAMAGVFLRAHPPQSPVLMTYGAAFPAFLEGFGPVSRLTYLPDVARLEQAMRESYHASDAQAVGVAEIAALGLEALMMRPVRLAPALRVIRSDWPILSIWAANRKGGTAPVNRAEDVLILRPDFDPEPVLLPSSGVAMLAALMEGKPMGAALSLGPEDEAGALLSLLLSGQAITEILP